MRGKQAPKRKINPDIKFNRLDIAKFINYIMNDGKKSIAQAILYDAFEIIAKKTKKEPLDIFDLAFKNISPAVEVRSRRIGGANYQVPIEVRGERQFTLASRWLLDVTRKKSGTPMANRLANELIEASKNQGEVVKKKEDVHKMAESNRAFAHFA